MSELVIERTALPKQLLEWLESEDNGAAAGLLIYREENDTVILRKVKSVDPAMMSRVRAAAERFRPALERLADS